MSIVVMAIIPARSGSKSVVDKNVKLLAGYPLIAYSIAAAKASAEIDRVIVSTDSESYQEIASSFGAETPFLRPLEYSGDKSPDYDFVKHALEWMQENEGLTPDLLIHLRPTTPLRDPNLIDKAIKTFLEDDSATALRSVHEMPESAYKTFEIEGQYLKCIGSGSMDIEAANRARQEFINTYQPNGYVDIIRSSFVMKENKVHGDHVLAFKTPPVVEVDSQEEFDYLEYQVSRRPEILKKIFS